MMAEDRFVLYGNKMALLYDVIVDSARLENGPKGGERMEEVWGQEERVEYLHMKVRVIVVDQVHTNMLRHRRTHTHTHTHTHTQRATKLRK